MYLIILETEKEAVDKNIEIAKKNKCSGDVTKYFSEVLENSITGKFGIVIPEKFVHWLNVLLEFQNLEENEKIQDKLTYIDNNDIIAFGWG